MNVLPTQLSLVRQLEAAGPVAALAQAADQAQRQNALTEERAAAHRQHLVAEAEGSVESQGLGADGRNPQGQAEAPPRAQAHKDKITSQLKNPGPSGRLFDIIA